MVETLARLGLKSAIACPGSRSTPLTVALARHPQIQTVPILDERSAGFWALGLAKASGLPTVLVCTSGTAGANFFPAVIEARESGVPLIVLTADRPPELRQCRSGQTIDQIKLFGNYVQYYSEMAVPVASFEMLNYARQTMVHAWRRSLLPGKGVVHLNCPFRDPLAPATVEDIDDLQSLEPNQFFAAISPVIKAQVLPATLPIEIWRSQPRGIIIAGVDQPEYPDRYCQAIAHLSKCLGYPVLAEALSPVRNYAGYFPTLITSYEFVLRHQSVAAELAPQIVIQFGALPTSKTLRAWLQNHQPQTWILAAGVDNVDALHNPSQQIWISSPEQLLAALPKQEQSNPVYRENWLRQEQHIRTQLAEKLQRTSNFVEAKIAWLLSQHLPSDSSIFFANSMTVRYAEFFWQANHRRITPYFNRGANGIDGTLSTALGIAQQHSPCVLLTGDLAFLHDTNGLLTVPQFRGSLTVIVVNNCGGGIFELLDIAQSEDVFEEYFVTPQTVDLGQLCLAYGVKYQAVNSEQALIEACQTLPKIGVRILEIKGDRRHDVQWLKSLFASFSE